jgi:hypothetical protein
MTDSIKREIEHLLDEPGDAQATKRTSDSLRYKLAATLSEALESSDPSTASDTPDIASMAAFIDGKLSGAERDKFVAALAAQPSLRADLDATSALVEAVADNTMKPPAHLLARANAQFAPAPQPASQREAGWDLSGLFSVFLPRQRLALALVAALALVLAVPAGLMIRDQSGGGGQPELSGVEEPVNAASQAEKDKACEEKKDKAKAEKSKSGTNATANAPDDACDDSKTKQDGMKGK